MSGFGASSTISTARVYERDLVDLHDLEAAHGELPDSRTDTPGF
jgi:hypothetical protein